MCHLAVWYPWAMSSELRPLWVPCTLGVQPCGFGVHQSSNHCLHKWETRHASVLDFPATDVLFHWLSAQLLLDEDDCAEYHRWLRGLLAGHFAPLPPIQGWYAEGGWYWWLHLTTSPQVRQRVRHYVGAPRLPFRCVRYAVQLPASPWELRERDLAVQV